MSENVPSNMPYATGGKVWKGSTRRPFSIKVRTFANIVLTPIIIVPLTALLALLAFTGAMNTYEARNPPQSDGYMQEYGYEQVDESYGGDTAQVTVAGTGEVKEVKISRYEGAVILYETREQLENKMDKVDSGTYMKMPSTE